MGGGFRPRGRTILPLLLTLLAGCSRPGGVRDESAAAQPTAPFRDISDPDLHPEVATVPGESSDSGVPFHDSQDLPVGTLLTVRLRDAIHSELPGATSGATFVAQVDEPIVIEGATIIPRGASVAGRIESARSSTIQHSRAYVRLTLDQVELAGRELPIRTSSLFARGNAVESQGRKASEMVSLEQGRRLTFRLAETVSVINQSSNSPVSNPPISNSATSNSPR
jgi:hypothetical protein